MKRSTTLFLPLVFLVLASCATTAQYSQQRFQDGIYMQPGEEPELVHLYTEEDFAAMAAQNIAKKQGRRDTLVVVVDDPWYSPIYNPYYYGGFPYHNYWNRWRIGGWYDPWFDLSFSWYYDWYSPWSWYDPFYGGWYDPWYGSYYYGYGYGYYAGYLPYGHRYGWYDNPYYLGGFASRGYQRNTVYTPRSQVQGSNPRRETRPGSGPQYRYGTSGSAGSSMLNRRTTPTRPQASRSSVASGTAAPSSTSSRREQGYNYTRSYTNKYSGNSSSSSSSSSTVNNSRTYSSGNSSSTTARTYSGNSSSSSAASRSTGGYSGGSSYSGGGSSFSGGGSHSGGASHSGGGGSHSGGGRR